MDPKKVATWDGRRLALYPVGADRWLMDLGDSAVRLDESAAVALHADLRAAHVFVEGAPAPQESRR